jgi:hypothetical protein
MGVSRLARERVAPAESLASVSRPTGNHASGCGFTMSKRTATTAAQTVPRLAPGGVNPARALHLPVWRSSGAWDHDSDAVSNGFAVY